MIGSERNMGRKLNDLTGQTFSFLTVTQYLGRQFHSSYYRCACRCGNVVDVQRGRFLLTLVLSQHLLILLIVGLTRPVI